MSQQHNTQQRSKIKHFIFMRFFSYQRKGYPYDVLDVDFLSNQLPLVKNSLRSFENQTNKDFELIFVMNLNFFENPNTQSKHTPPLLSSSPHTEKIDLSPAPKYEFIFSALKNSTSLPLKFMKNNISHFQFKPQFNSELSSLINTALNEYDFVITTRMDFDDFVHKNAVMDIQNKVNECDNVLSYGYNRGYQYIYGELYPHLLPNWRRKIGYCGDFQSLILKSSFAKNLPCFTVESLSHVKVVPELKEFLEKNGVEYTPNMFQQNDSINAYIYFRHDFSQEQLVKHKGEKFTIPNLKALTTADITKKQLEEEFGFFHELKSIE